MNGISCNFSILRFSLLTKDMFKHKAFKGLYLFLWGQPVHLGVAIEICWATQEIHIKLRVRCWGYQTSQPAAGTSPTLLTGGWTAHSESDIFPPAHELWPDDGWREESSRNRGRQTDVEREVGTKGKRQKHKETRGSSTEHSAHRKHTHTACTVATYTMMYICCHHTNTTWHKIYCRHVDYSDHKGKTSLNYFLNYHYFQCKIRITCTILKTKKPLASR